MKSDSVRIQKCHFWVQTESGIFGLEVKIFKSIERSGNLFSELPTPMIQSEILFTLRYVLVMYASNQYVTISRSIVDISFNLTTMFVTHKIDLDETGNLYVIR